MPKSKYGKEELQKVYQILQKNPNANYEEIERAFFPLKINANSLVKRLQRMGCIKIERDVDASTGKIRGSSKTCIREP